MKGQQCLVISLRKNSQKMKSIKIYETCERKYWREHKKNDAEYCLASRGNSMARCPEVAAKHRGSGDFQLPPLPMWLCSGHGSQFFPPPPKSMPGATAQTPALVTPLLIASISENIHCSPSMLSARVPGIGTNSVGVKNSSTHQKKLRGAQHPQATQITL